MPPPQKNSLGLFGLTIFTIVSLALGAYYRFPSLGERPMHTDEAILAIKSAEFQETGHFKYDPSDFHGPGLHDVTLVWSKLAGWGHSSTWTETQLRTVTVICGLLLLLSTLLLRDALGRLGTGLAMLLISISPMMVYYSRYFIMEVPLVLFITLSIAAMWRYSQGGGRWWLVLAGLALGMQHATKETFAINVVAAMIGFIVAKTMVGNFSPRRGGFDIGPQRGRAVRPWLWVIVVAIITSIAIYSGGFKDWQAVKDSATTYLSYLQRSTGSGHEKPWHYYFTLIFWRKDGLIWSEAMIGGLGIVGMLYAFVGNHMKNAPRQAFLIFLSVYTFILFTIYSFLAYKTPWSILSAQHALTLLAGVGAAIIGRALKVEWSFSPLKFLVNVFIYMAVIIIVHTIISFFNPSWSTYTDRILLGIFVSDALISALTKRFSRAFKISFFLGMYHLIAQTNIAIHLYAADSRNPYVYSHTSSNLLTLLPKVRELQKIAPDDSFNVLVINRDAGWPLPWYWRDIKTVHYTTTIPETIDARVIVAELDMQPALEAKFAGKTYTMQGPFGLRPGVMLNLWVEQSLWDRFTLRKQQEATAK